MNKTCPACRGQFKDYISKNNFLIVRCQNCGLGHTLDLGSQTGDYHRDQVYIGNSDLFANLFLRRVKIINQLSNKPGRALDIGSSTGLMLSLLRKMGWQVQGVEMSLGAAQVAKQQGISTLVSTFEKAKLKTNFFDAIILNQTLEHLEDPVKVIAKASKLLKKNGVILIDVPNFGSLSSKLDFDSWPYLLPEEHLWHFTYQSLKYLLEDSGFKIIHQSMPSGVWDCGSASRELWLALTGFKRRFFKELLTFIPDWIVSKLQLGTSLTILARKQ